MYVVTGDNSPSEQVGEVRQETVEEKQEKPGSSDAMEVEQASTDNPTASSDNPTSSESHDPSHDQEPESEPEPEPEWVGQLRAVDTILSGEKTVVLHQEFLIRNNHTDLQILKNTKVCKLRLLITLTCVFTRIQ